MNESEQKTREERNKRRAIIFLVAVAVIGAGIFLYLHFTRPKPLHVRAYYRGNVDINMDAKVFFRKDKIGDIVDIQAGRRSVHLLVRRPGVEDRDESLTLEEDYHGRIIDQSLNDLLVVHTRDRVTITSGDSSLNCSMMRLPEQSAWVFILEKSRPGTVEFNGYPIEQPICAPLPSGYPIRIGNVVLQWDEPGIYTRVEFAVDTLNFFKEARLTRSTLSTTIATLSTGFALARPGIRLTLAPDDGLDASLVDRTEMQMELVPGQDIDIYATLNQIGGYLTDRRYMYSPPHNRVERIVEDVNMTLEKARGGVDTLMTRGGRIAADVDRVTADASYYLSSPAALRQPPRTRLDSIVADVNAIGITVRNLSNRVQGVVNNLGKTVESVNDTTLPRINSAAYDISETLFQLDKTLREIRVLAGRLQSETIPVAEGEIGRTSTEARALLREIESTTRELEATLRGIRRFIGE